jgi:hypothetical protein
MPLDGAMAFDYPVILNPSGFDLLGDSRQLEQSPPGFPGNSSWHYFNQANAQAGNRYQLVNLQGYAGKRSDQYFAMGLQTCLASNAKYCVIWSTFNDINQGASARQAWFGGDSYNGSPGWLGACQQLLARGKIPILIAECGYTAFNALQVSYVYQMNQYMRQFCASSPAIFIDFNPLLQTLTSTPGTIILQSVYFQDGLHPSTLGSYYMGTYFNVTMQSLVPPINQEMGFAGETADVMPLVNPNFLTTTGGTVSGGTLLSGTVPASWGLVMPAGWTSAVTFPANNYGKDFSNNIVNSGPGAAYLFQIIPAPVAGATYQAGMEVSVNAGGQRLIICETLLQNTNADSSSAFTTDMGLQSAYSINPSGVNTAYTYTTCTPKLICPNNVSSLTLIANFWFASAGNITAAIRRAWVRRVLT